MQIAIDAHHIGLRKTGCETYVTNLVQHLAKLPANDDDYLVYLGKGQHPAGLGSHPSFATRQIPTSSTPVRFALYYPYESWRRPVDIFHGQFSIPPFLRTRSVVTVYDLCYERFPEFFTAAARRQMKLLVPWSCRRASHVITISESSKRDLVEMYRLDPRRVTVTYPGHADIFRPMDREQAMERLAEAYGISPPFILFVGNLEPRKNLSRLLQAFASLKRRRRIKERLVIVGQKSWLHDAIFETLRSHHLEQEVIFTNYVPSADLPAFYSAATAMVYPSIFEGFGLPVVEAMACGTPVVTSWGSSLEEIALGAAVLVDPYSVASIAAAIEKVVNGVEVRQAMREAGRERAARFSFLKMAAQTRDVYHQV